MAFFSPDHIVGLVQQLGGDPQQAQQLLGSVGGQIDTGQHADLLNQLGVDPSQLESGGYQQQLSSVVGQIQNDAGQASQDFSGGQGFNSGADPSASQDNSQQW